MRQPRIQSSSQENDMSAAVAIAATAAVAGTAYTIYQGERQADMAREARAQQEAYQSQSLAMQKKAQAEAAASAAKQAKASDEAVNAATRKSPDVSSIVAASEAAQQGGVGSTMLTGPTGVDPNDLKLGKSTLLGA
jgi:hypothetical protein